MGGAAARVEASRHVGGDEQQLVALLQLEHGAHESSSRGALEAAAERGEVVGEEQPDARLVVGGARGEGEEVVREFVMEDGGVTNLLQSECVASESGAARKNSGEFAQKAKADIERGYAERSGSSGSVRCKHGGSGV